MGQRSVRWLRGLLFQSREGTIQWVCFSHHPSACSGAAGLVALSSCWAWRTGGTVQDILDDAQSPFGGHIRSLRRVTPKHWGPQIHSGHKGNVFWRALNWKLPLLGSTHTHSYPLYRFFFPPFFHSLTLPLPSSPSFITIHPAVLCSDALQLFNITTTAQHLASVPKPERAQCCNCFVSWFLTLNAVSESYSSTDIETHSQYRSEAVARPNDAIFGLETRRHVTVMDGHEQVPLQMLAAGRSALPRRRARGLA